MSHGTHEEHAIRVQNIRAVAAKLDVPLPILFDLSGPKIRTGEYTTERITITKDSTIVLTTDPHVGDETKIHVNYERLAQEVKPGSTIMLDDGKKRLEVERVEGTEIYCRVVVGGELKPRRGVNVPGAYLSISTITEKDKRDVVFGVAQGADYFALSFTRRPEDIEELRGLIRAAGASTPIIAKIETMESIENLDAIIAASDGVMVARGDLAIEVPTEMVPIYQKQIIVKANALGKPAIIATQMLESMVHSPVPTRAEVSDVANAILDGTDGIMLSEESALGEYAVEAVEMMTKVSATIEGSLKREKVVPDQIPSSIAQSVYHIAHEVRAKVIVALTETGATAQRVARFKPDCPIIAITAHDDVVEKLALVRGVYPYKSDALHTFADVTASIPAFLIERGIVQHGDTIAITAGLNFGTPGSTNMLVVLTV
jgi:pyruvate kinase